LLASLAAHGGLIAILLLLVSGETHPGVLFIDLETRSEREAPVAGAEPRPAPAGRNSKRAATGSPRPAGRAADRSGPAMAPSSAVLPSPVAPAAPEPAPAKEREAVTATPEAPRPPEPAVAVVPPREAAPEVAQRSEDNTPAAEPRVSQGSAGGESAETAGAPRGAAGGGTAAAGTSGGGAGGGGGNAVASGGPAGGAPGAEYRGYLAQMRRRLMEALRYPQPARNRGLSGTVLLDISIESSGAIANVSVTRSSSHPLLDEAALEAARSLSPQPFPKGLAPRPLRVRLPVVFDLQ
jgi:protein TonB